MLIIPNVFSYPLIYRVFDLIIKRKISFMYIYRKPPVIQPTTTNPLWEIQLQPFTILSIIIIYIYISWVIYIQNL
jgi:hypothetical protein